MSDKKISIAIDGPASSGKTTIAKILSKNLGFYYLNTGAIYRAVGLYFFENNLDPTDEKQVKDNIDDINVEIIYKNLEQLTYVNGLDVTSQINKDFSSDYASKISSHPIVRKKLIKIQRNVAKNFNIIAEGRDIGTNILPDADIKIFLTASLDIRAERRYKQHLDYYNEKKLNIDNVLKDVENRDVRDTTRKLSPLIAAKDAILIDNSNKSIEEVSSIILDLLKKKGICKK